MEVTKWLKPSMQRITKGDPASVQAVMLCERWAILEKVDAQADPITLSGKADTTGELSEGYLQSLCRGSGDSMHTRKARATRETPWRGARIIKPDAREGQAGRLGVRGLSSLVHLRDHGSYALDAYGARQYVGEGVKSCPRAGCGKSACPVR
jgi:hypothetical protein